MIERELFAQALALSKSEREAFLVAAGGANPALRDRVAALLAEHEQLGSYLEIPAAGCSAASERGEQRPGLQIGRYRLVEEIGEGGMGTVWAAEQTNPVSRRVALKLIRPGMDTRPVLARFSVERQALALMDHPNIAKFIDAGMTGEGQKDEGGRMKDEGARDSSFILYPSSFHAAGRPYFVMELVQGAPITDYCDRAKLPLGERLRLFVAVCHAVQHAHQKGVIHRDLKPSNILVGLCDGQPVPKIIDFGLAKATGEPLLERTNYTAQGQMVGTPMYMSPEQAELSNVDVDTRTDIYSLGVILYELLTGTTPLERQDLKTASFQEILRRIKEVEPPRPSVRLARTLSRRAHAAQCGPQPEPTGVDAGAKRVPRIADLDWIVMKALDKDRGRRYETANSLARDVERYLHGDPVEACPPSTIYRLKRFASKHRGVLATAITIAALLIGGTIISTWLAIWALKAERAAGRAKQQALALAASMQEAKQAAEKSATTERELRKIANSKLEEMNTVWRFLEEHFQTMAPAANSRRGPERSLHESVEAAIPVANFSTQPLVEAHLRRLLGRVYRSLYAWDKAAEQYAAARALYLSGHGPDEPDTLSCTSFLAHVYLQLGRGEEALRLLEENVQSRTQKGTAHSADGLYDMQRIAECYTALDRREAAVDQHKLVLELRRACLGPNAPDTLQSMDLLAWSYLAAGQHAAGAKLREELLDLHMAKFGRDHGNTVYQFMALADAYTAAGRHAEAVLVHKAELARRKAAFGPDHDETLACLNHLAFAQFERGRYLEGFQLLEEEIALGKAKSGIGHDATLQRLHHLAHRYFEFGYRAEAQKLREETLRQRLARFGPDDPGTLGMMHELANSYGIVGRRSEALKLNGEALARRRLIHGPDHPDTLASMNNVANELDALGQHDEALQLREQTLALRKARLGPHHSDVFMSMRNLGRSYMANGRGDEALKLISKALAGYCTMFGETCQRTFPARRNLAECHAALGQHAEALRVWTETLALQRALFPPDHPDTLWVLKGMAESLIALDRADEAEPLLDECLELSAGQLLDPSFVANVQNLRERLGNPCWACVAQRGPR